MRRGSPRSGSARSTGRRGWRLEAESPAALNEALDEARRAGALLVELSRDLRDLEDVLAEEQPGGARGGVA